MSKNLLYVEDTSEKQWHIIRFHKIRLPFYTENTLRKLLCQTKDRVATFFMKISLKFINSLRKYEFLLLGF